MTTRKARAMLFLAYLRQFAFAAGSAGILAAGIGNGATPGSLDAAFGTGGKVTTNFNSTVPVFGEGRGVAVQADGKYVVCGDSTEGSVQHYALLRYTADGSLDATFGTGGLVRTLTLGGFSLCNMVAIQPSDQKIVAVGFNDANSNDFTVVRYTTAGALDSSFGTGGVVTAHFGTGLDRANDVVIQADGKIVVAGQVSTASNGRDMGVVRLNSNGTLDTSFGCPTPGSCSGMATVTITTGTDDARGVAVDSVGRIVLVGRSGTNAAIARLNANGTLDTSFGSPNGFRTMTLNNGQVCYYGPSDKFNAVAILPGNKIIAAGESYSNYHPDPLFGVQMTQMAFFQFNADGSTDTGFGPGGQTTCHDNGAYQFAAVANTTAGLVLVNIYDGAPYNFNLGNSGGQSSVRRVFAASGGKIVGTGYADNNAAGQFDYAAVRLDANGSLDTSFGCPAGSGCTGKAGIDLNGQGRADSSVGGLLDGSGRVVMTGYSYVNPSDVTTPLVGTVRLNANGVLDTNFNSTGMIFTQMYGGSQDIANAIAVQSDGKVILGGLTNNGTNFDFALARYTTAGALDGSFGSGGKVTLNSTGSANDTVTALAVRAGDGSIYAAGQAGSDVAVVKFSSAGALITAWGTSGIARASFTGTGAEAKAIAIQPDDKVVAAGINYPGGTDDAVVVRFTSTGALDTSFAGTGKVTINWGSGTFDEIYALALQPDGKIVVAGRTNVTSGGTYFKIGLARLTTAGALDTTFGCPAGSGCTGMSVTSINTGSDEAYSVAVRLDGKIVVGGKTNTPSGTNDFFAARFHANGTLDTGFGTNGYRIVAVSAANNDQSTGMLYRVDGRIVLFGSVFTGVNDDFAVALLTRDGDLDASIGGAGIVTTPIGGNDFSNGIAIAPDGSWFLGGNDGGAADFSVARMFSPTHEPAFFDLTTDSGRSSTDDITNVNTPTFVGSCFHGDTVQMRHGLQDVGSPFVCPANDRFSFTFPSTLSDGAHSLGGVATNALTGGSSGTFFLPFLIDTIPPPAPVITIPAAGIDYPLNGTVSGTAEANAIVRVLEGVTPVCTATADGGGAWSCAMNVTAGSHTIKATAEDVAGNVSADSTSVTFTAKYPTTTAIGSGNNPSTYGQSVTFTATVTSSAGGPAPTGPVQFSIDSAGFGAPVALVPGASDSAATTTTSALGGGTHSVSVAYLGDSVQLTSASTTLTQTVNKAPQAITFGALGAKVLGDAAFGVSATSDSGLAVAFTSLTAPVCTVAGTTVTLVAPGVCTIAANQAGDGNYLAAPQVTQTFTVKRLFNIVIEGGQEVPVNAASGTGSGTALYDPVANTITLNLTFSGLSSAVTGAHLHGPAVRGVAAAVKVAVGTTSPITNVAAVTAGDNADILAGKWYVNIHTTNFPGGEIRGQLDDLGATPRHTLTVNRTGTGSGTVTSNVAGINCGATCSASVPQGLAVTLTAAATTGNFTGWSGGGCAGTGTCQVTVGAAITVTAAFNLPPVRHSDANGDGRGDVIWRDSTGGLVYQWQMNGLAISAESYMPTVPAGWSIAGIGEFSGDGKADVLWREPTSGFNYLWIVDGIAVTGGGYLPTVPSPWEVVGVGDASGDRKADVLWRNPATGQNYLWIMNGVAIASEGYLPSVAGTSWKVVGFADYSGDGKADVLWRNDTTGENYLWLMDGMVIASQGYMPTVAGSDWEVVGAPDANGDGMADVLWRNKVTGENFLWPMNGIGLAGEGFLPTVADVNWKVVGFGDYDGDGKGDVLWRNSTNGFNYLWTLNGVGLTTLGFLPTVPGANWQPAK